MGPPAGLSPRPPTDPWGDYKNERKGETPWMRDRRLQMQRERLQHQKERLTAMKTSNNPFEETTTANTNPFESSSSYSDSTSSRPPPSTMPPPSVDQTRKAPDFKKSAFSPYLDPVPAYRVENHNATNPFDPGRPHSESKHHRPMVVQQHPSMSRPLQKNPKHLQYTDDSVQDSLDRFLDTTDETAASSTQEEEERRSAGDSATRSTTPSDKALQALETLKQSFHRPHRKNSNDSTPATPIHRYTTTPTPTLSLSTARIMEEPITPMTVHTGAEPTTPMSVHHGESVRSQARKVDSATTRLPRTPQDFPSFQSKQRRLETTPEPQTPQQPERTSSTATNQPETINLALHDLCDEARTTDDVAWRNALFLLCVEPHLASQVEPECQMTVLHMCCMSLDVKQPPPIWMVRALIYTNPLQCQMEDSGGRLPLHLLAATSGNVDLMQLLVEEYPASVAHRDSRGFTPLCLLLKNDQVALTLEHLRILLGQTHQQRNDGATNSNKSSKLFRRGDHLKPNFFEDLHELQMKQQVRHEELFQTYPDDVQQNIRKITQWKRRQVNRGLHPQTTQLASVFENPAAMATPTARQLPLHLLVRRPPASGGMGNEIGGIKVASPETLLRVLIAAYPKALITTDAQGRTPLLTALLQTNSIPNTEAVELLLGKYTPSLAEDEPHLSPAKMPSSETLQLPLHVAAEEMLHNFALLSTIAESYPQAVHMQDIRGRTPLHCALENYRSMPVNQDTFHLLLMTRNHSVETVSKIRDGDGKRPVDLILEHPKALQRWKIEDTDDVLCAFFNASFDAPRNIRQERELLEQMRMLPPWLRRSACASSHVQHALLEEMASPLHTAFILFQGGTLVSLLIVLRLALEGTGIDFDSWVLVNYFCAYHMVTQIIYWGNAWYYGEFYRMVLTNGWRWIDLWAICCSIGVAAVVQTDITMLRDSGLATVTNFSNFIPADEDAVVATLGGWATGLLWASLVGYLVQWWCGMAVFVGSAAQIIQIMFWPLFLGAMGIVCMSQIIKTVENCANGNICDIADAYTTVYWLILGEPILGSVGELSVYDKQTPTSMVVLLIFFTLLWIMWLLSAISIVVSEAKRLDRDKIALRWFWEPKVALDTSPARQESMKQGVTRMERYCNAMEFLWHVLSCSIKGGPEKHEMYWYAWCLQPGIIIVTRCVACMVLPIWFCLGIVTLGLLWPPQIRRWLFSTKAILNGKKPKGAVQERLTAAKLSHLKGEMEEYQTKTLEQNHAIQRDLAQIKELLFRAS